MEYLFPAKISDHRQPPLGNSASELFTEHCIGAAGLKVIVPGQKFLYLVSHTCDKCQANLRHVEALEAHAEELQAHIAALEDCIGNLIEEHTTNGSAGSAAITAFQEISETTLNNKQ